MNVLTSRAAATASTISRLYARSMQPWSVIRMRVMRSRSRFIRRDAVRRHHESSRARDAAHVIGAGVHRGEQLADFLRRIPQIGVERDDPFATHALEAGEDRQM